MSNVPKLRFPGFEGEWGEKKLGEITNKTGVKYNNQKEYGVYSISNKYGFILQEEQFEGGRLGGLDKALYQIVNSGEFAYNPARINVGSIALLENEVGGIVSSLYVCFKLTPEVGKLFFKQYIKTYAFRVGVLRNTEGSVREYLFYDNLSNIALFFPDAVEQTKIANFLTHLDKKITKQDEKVATLEQYKKGLMQKIFSQKLRFKGDEGRDYPEWESSALGVIANVLMGQSPSSKTYNQTNIGVPLIQGNADIVNRKTNPTRFTNEPTKVCNKGDLLMTVRAPVGYIGKSDHNACIGRGVCAIQPKQNNEYLYQYLLFIEKNWRNIEQGSTFTAVGRTDVSKVAIPHPTLPEQTKIATFLSLYDRKIEKEKAKLEALREQKKGLLQSMFV